MTVLDEPVVLLDEARVPIGQLDKAQAHRVATPLHLAFSCYLFDNRGRVLVTRRALSKATWPGVWTNTCCGHPRPGEPMADAIRRRLAAELLTGAKELREVLPQFAYSARDASGIEENEVCPVYSGRALHPDRPLRPNPDEVMEWAWVGWEDLVRAVRATPFVFSPWAVAQVGQMDDPPGP